MLFRKQKKEPDDRVLGLKARVDRLRQQDEANRARRASLNDFLEGGDVVTSRDGPDTDLPGPPESSAGPEEVILAAELERYLKRQEYPGYEDEGDMPPPDASPSTSPERD